MKNDDKRKYSVYMHISPSHKYYIGITSLNVKDRWDSGHGYRQNRYFFNSIRKHGWENFEHVVVTNNLSVNEAKKLEQRLIKHYKANNRIFGYNNTDGGDTSCSKQRKKVFQYTNKGDLVAQYNSIRDAERILKIDHNAISKCCRGSLKSAGGYLWSFTNRGVHIPTHDTAYDVCKIDSDLKSIKYYSSISEASANEGIDYYAVHRKCRDLPVISKEYYCYRYDLPKYLSSLKKQKHKNTVYQLDFENKLIGVYSDFVEAGLKMGVHSESIRYACKHCTLSCGFRWLSYKYNENDIEDIAEAICIGSAFLICNEMKDEEN